MSDYLEIARAGKNDWWRYLLSFPAIVITYFLVGSIPVLFLMFYVFLDEDPATGFTEVGFEGVPVIPEFLAIMLSFLPLLLATLLAVRFVHNRPVKTLITASPQVRWRRIFAGAGVWFLIASWISLVEAVLYPGRYVLTLDLPTLLLFAALALILIPIQTSAEELFFRGYLLQWIGLRLKNKWVLALVNGVLFFLPHAANPEMATGSPLIALGYFAIGFFFALITLQDDGMELALGMHASNNLYAGLIANYTVSALPSPSLFTVQTLDPVYSLVSAVAGMVVFYLIFFRPTRSGSATPPG